MAKPSQPLSLLQTPRDYSDFHLRFEFRIATKNADSGVNIRQPFNPALWLQMQVQVRDDSVKPYRTPERTKRAAFTGRRTVKATSSKNATTC